MTPTNKLRWFNTKAKYPTAEQIDKHRASAGCSPVYSKEVLTVPAKRVLQQWWSRTGESSDIRGEWRNIEEVSE